MTDFPASRLPAVAPAVAAPPHFADRRAAQVEPALQVLISLTHEALAHVRISFA